MATPLEQEIFQAIRSSQSRPHPVVDAATGKTWIGRFQEVLKGLPWEDRTDYRYRYTGSYTFQVGLPFTGVGNWAYAIRIRISGMGPYVMHSLMRESVTDVQWGGACQLSREALTEEQAALLTQLRESYGKFGLTEVDDHLRSLVVHNVRLSGLTGELNVFRCLFMP